MTKIKILLADDHSVVRKGMKTLLEEEPNLEIIGEAIDGIDALEKIEILSPNIVILDLTMPNMNGIEASMHISKKFPKVKILIFSMHNDADYILKSIKNGASGYLLKDSGKEEIMNAIKAVSVGKKYFPPDISALIIDELLTKSSFVEEVNSSEKTKFFTQLTKKEKQILDHIIEGKNSREIADYLKLSIRTVDNHRANMMRKTKAKNTADLVNMASSK